MARGFNRAYAAQERRELVRFARMLVGYGCAGVGQEPDDTTLCNQCGACEARIWLEDRKELKPQPRRPLTDQEAEVLRRLSDEWQRPMDVGGRDGSHHSDTLQRLVIKGYAEMRRHWVGLSGGHWRYRKVQDA